MAMRTRAARPQRAARRRAAACALAIAALSLLAEAATPDRAKTPAGLVFQLPIWPASLGTPQFALADTEGRPHTLADYRGEIVVVVFGYTRCPDVCPTELYKLASARKRLAALAARVHVLFVSLDPEHDTPATLGTYLRAFDPSFVGLTGTTDDIDRTAAAFHVQFARVPTPGGYVIDHSTGAYVFDAQGQLRLVAPLDARIGVIAHDLQGLARADRR